MLPLYGCMRLLGREPVPAVFSGLQPGNKEAQRNMSNLRAPGLGPIVGHTTDTTCRVWIRADDPADSGVQLDPQRRTVGIAGVFAEGGKRLGQPRAYYFRLHREFDRTGTFVLGESKGAFHSDPVLKLKPGTEYRVRLGTLTLDDPYRDDTEVEDDELTAKLPPAKVWIEELDNLKEKKSEAVFCTFPRSNKTVETMSFLMGSCRYPGLLWKIKHADRIFGPLLREAQRSRGGITPSFVVMTGDQIYADMFTRMQPIGRADTYEEFQERYHSAFGSPNMRRLLRNIPTYMILDDHEIEDNWRQDRILKDAKYRLFTIAIDAYMSYQWSHGPRSFGRRLFYTFDFGGYPFFVLDTRTQRYMDDDEEALEDNHLLGRPSPGDSAPSQVDRLLDWLAKQPREVPKFIVTSSVFVPNPVYARSSKAKKQRLEQSDSWPAFPTTRRAVLDCIVKHKIQNVIFLSGDIHCANVAQMFFDNGAEDLKAYSITSSAFYWPFPFADGDPANFVHDSRKSGQEDAFTLSDGTTMHYKVWNFTQEDNFCRLDVDRPRSQLTVRTFDQDGQIVEHEHKRGKLEAKLSLHPW